MSVNKYRPHVLVLPEDDANRQIANGFLLHHAIAARSIQVLEEVGGWRVVLDRFRLDHVAGMERHPDRLVILLIDFDGREDRIKEVRASVPANLAERVFVLGVWNEPEDLKSALALSYESLGIQMAEDCHQETWTIWENTLLKHNAPELHRLREHVRPILFPTI
jgi:hypothetical protein